MQTSECMTTRARAMHERDSMRYKDKVAQDRGDARGNA